MNRVPGIVRNIVVVLMFAVACDKCPPSKSNAPPCDPLKAPLCRPGQVVVCAGRCVTPRKSGEFCTPDPCADDGTCEAGLSCSGTGWLDSKPRCIDLHRPAGAACRSADSKVVPCATGTYCPDNKCRDDGTSSCSVGQVVGMQCDSDFTKPRCFACEPGLSCIGYVCLKPCKKENNNSECPCSFQCGATATALSPSTAPGFCYTCLKLRDSGCGEAKPCCDGSFCGRTASGASVFSKCCRTHGLKCDDDYDCCPGSGDRCLGGICTCRTTGQPCRSPGECCAGMTCGSNGLCAKPPTCRAGVDCAPTPSQPATCGSTVCRGGVESCQPKSPAPKGCTTTPPPPPPACIAEGSGDCSTVADCCPKEGMICHASGSTAPSLCICPHDGDACDPPTKGCCGDVDSGGRKLMCGTKAGATTAGVCTFDCGTDSRPPRTAGKEHSCDSDHDCCIGYFCGGPDIANGCIRDPSWGP